MIARQPFTVMERLVFSKKVENYQLPQPPIFIIGHWRSGTTHLHNLMSSAPQFSTIDFGQTAMPHNLLNPTRFIGRAAMSTAVPKDRGMDRVKMGMKEPQEEEMALGNLNPVSYYNVFYYPQEMQQQFDRSIFLEGLTAEEVEKFKEVYVRLLKKLSIAGKGKPLLLKNPASTARVELLDQLFSGARFIHIVRNPYEVFASMLHHYPRLFNAFAWQKFDNIDLEEMVFYKYGRLMKGFLDQRKQVEGRLLETSYEKIVSDPVGEIGRFYDSFGLTGKDQALDEIKSYVSARKGYKRNQYQLTADQVERIQSEWGFALDEWGYDVPDSIEVV
ncbi:MAG: sulfotransferase [Verrucomicrobiales bacterium]|nr:sulfotransferase [Verrucomicrobiales bacterium]